MEVYKSRSLVIEVGERRQGCTHAHGAAAGGLHSEAIPFTIAFQLYFLHNFIPFVGFGFCDNFVGLSASYILKELLKSVEAN